MEEESSWKETENNCESAIFDWSEQISNFFSNLDVSTKLFQAYPQASHSYLN